jgi:hypothetical protein
VYSPATALNPKVARMDSSPFTRPISVSLLFYFTVFCSVNYVESPGSFRAFAHRYAAYRRLAHRAI